MPQCFEKKWPLILSKLCLLYLFFLLIVFQQCSIDNNGFESVDDRGDYLGDQACKICHQEEYKDWFGSHHDLAMQEANDSTVLGNFNNIEFTSNGLTSRFYKKDGKFFAHTEGSDGKLKDFEVLYTFGVIPLQQYMVELPGGRLQCLLIAWDSTKKEWFDLMPDERLPNDDWLHWTKGSMTWNTMCADCHSTNLQKNYDELSKSFDTQWDIIDVSCEACHGPAEKHLAYINSKQYGSGKKVPGSFMYQPAAQNKKELIDDCARCHSRRGPITEKYNHDETFMDQYIPGNVAPALYHTDGQILEEVYVYGSFLQSKMYYRDVSCIDCHNPHSLDIKFDGNTLCSQCHVPETYDVASHHFHVPESEGAQCINCHMPGRIYMGNDYRRDHSFRAPRPDLSEKYNTPNACNDCHFDKSFTWANDKIIEWYGQNRIPHFSPVLSAINNGDLNAVPDLISMVGDTSVPEIIQASAVQLLGNLNLPEANQKLIQALDSKDAFVRYSAVSAFGNYPQNERFQYLTPLLRDSIRSVRIHTAYMLADVHERLFPREDRESFLMAIAEFKKSLVVQADFPAGQLMRGQYYHKKNQLDLAEEAYKEAIRQDPYLAQPYFNLANLKYSQKDFKSARIYFESTIEKDSNFFEAYYSLGLLLAEMNELQSAELRLAKAAILSGNPRYFYNWGLTLQNLNRHKDAENAYLQALSIDPLSESNLYALSILYIQQKRRNKARKIVTQLLSINPQNQEYQNLMKAAN